MQTETQQPDTRPGPYYVSAIDGSKIHLMAGPYAQHTEALADVERARDIADKADARAHFMAWGTCRAEGSTDIGTLNKYKLI
jgi:hypothetical protein